MRRGSADSRLIGAAAFVRACAAGCIGVLLGIFLGARGLQPAVIGLVIGSGIAGAAFVTALVAYHGDGFGRRRTLVALALLVAGGLLATAYVRQTAVLLLAAFGGMLNGMGRDRGPSGALEQAMLPQTSDERGRTWVLAWYNVLLDVGHAAGAAAAMLPSVLVSSGWTRLGAHRAMFVGAAGAIAVSATAYAFCSTSVEAPAAPHAVAVPVDSDVRHRVSRLAALFGIDSLGGGFLSSALIAYWFLHRYAVSESSVAALFFAARVLNAVSHLAAAWLARRIGLLNTMVFTHLPSSLFLLAAPLAPAAPLAAALFLAREGLVEMDVPTRQSYVMAVVPPAQRTFASGVTNLTRTAGWAAGAAVAGTAMQQIALAAPLVIGGMLKIGYDIVLYRMFRHIRPPEECGGG
jgi:MFS family permease